MKKLSFLVFLAFYTQVFATIIPADRVTIWQGNVGVQGGIPTRSTIFQTLSPGATAAQINAAIASCPSGQVVKLNAGTYNLTGAIFLTKSSVTLRGAGPGSTNLTFIGVGADYINMVQSGSFNPSTVTNWTAGFSQGTTTITVTSAAGFSQGQLVLLDQLNDSTYIGGGSEGATDLGSGTNRLQSQLCEITNVSSNQITISPPVLMPNYSIGQSPRMWLVSPSGKIHDTGIEDLSIDGTGGSATNTINMEVNQNCWIKNVNSKMAGTQHVHLFRSKNIEIVHSDFHESRVYGSSSYGIQQTSSSYTLIENNIFHHITAPVVDDNESASVRGYNYATDMFVGNTTNENICFNSNHNAHSHFNLWEGNIGTNVFGDYIHGSASHITVFRNYLVGQDVAFPPVAAKTQYTWPVALQKYNRYYNIVGNVLGKAGYHNSYETLNDLFAGFKAIYYLGQEAYGSGVSDSLVKSTLLRHGNYDHVNAGIIWDITIADHSIPNSLYLAAKPAWFGNLTWPAIDPGSPAITPSNNPAGFRYVNGFDPPGGGTPTPTPVPLFFIQFFPYP